jgi:hypothetical protein
MEGRFPPGPELRLEDTKLRKLLEIYDPLQISLLNYQQLMQQKHP